MAQQTEETAKDIVVALLSQVEGFSISHLKQSSETAEGVATIYTRVLKAVKEGEKDKTYIS
ncbi:MAG: hypothetical protein GEU78_17525 [Actinobacteria bacterium]|nr:hypothetical protein [Actinomycetota bacterium]